VPASIVKAIGAVQSQIEAVKKSQKNTHGGYMFASTDDIYAAVTAKMGEVGLTVIAMEDRLEIKEGKASDGKISRWLELVMHFVLATQDDTWDDPRNKRTIFVQITGPQTFQAAQSYCEKAFLRALFKIPTGDMDIDSMPEGFEYSPLVRPMAPPPPPAAAPAKAEAALVPDVAPEPNSAAVQPPAGEPVAEEPATEAPLEAVVIDWAPILELTEATMAKMSTEERLAAVVERFNAAHDGKITQEIGAKLDEMFEKHTARIRAAKKPEQK
jgi:hypothetical protein